MDDKIVKANKQIEKILKENNLKIGYKISFPIYNILPDEVNLSFKILGKHGMKIDVIVEPIKEK